MGRKSKELIEELLVVIANDDVGVTHSLLDLALMAGEEEGLEKDYMEDLLDSTYNK